jgi:hypothetical protein
MRPMYIKKSALRQPPCASNVRGHQRLLTEDSESSPNSFHDKRPCLQTEHARARTDSQAEMVGALCSRGVTERIVEILGYNSVTKVRGCVQFDLSFRKGLHPGRTILLRCLCIRKINQSDPISSQFPSLDKPSERFEGYPGIASYLPEGATGNSFPIPRA